jgi:hypothetical protein
MFKNNQRSLQLSKISVIFLISAGLFATSSKYDLRRERSDVFDKQEYNTILVPYNYIFPC